LPFPPPNEPQAENPTKTTNKRVNITENLVVPRTMPQRYNRNTGIKPDK